MIEKSAANNASNSVLENALEDRTLTNAILNDGQPKPTNLPYSRKSIVKLQSALLQLIAEYGEDYLPEERYNWYQLAGISKSTFVDSISTYANFLFFSKEELLNDLAGCFNRLNLVDFASLLDLFLRLFVLDESGSPKAEIHNTRRSALIIATMKYPPAYWEDLFFFLTPCLKAEYPYAEEIVIKALVSVYAAVMRVYLLDFVRLNTPEALLIPLKRVLLHFKKALFLDTHDFYFLVKDYSDLRQEISLQG